VTAVSVPGYDVLEPLGQGGYGVVYRARQLTIDREVAIKVDTRVILDERDQRRFFREVRAAGRLSGHPHVVELYDAGVLTDGRPYLVMELCPGGSLADRARLPASEVIDIGQKIADALAAAHDLGVLHRDIKPGNILLKRYGTVALADFGLAAVVDAGRDSSVTLAAMTPAYAAPEVFHLHPPTVQSDVYALAATLYTLLTGYPPHYPANGDDLSVPEIIRRHELPIDDVPGVRPELMAILRRGLAKDPAHRYPEAAALQADLVPLAAEQVGGPRHAVTRPVTTVAKRRPSPPPPAAPYSEPAPSRSLARPSPAQLPPSHPSAPGAGSPPGYPPPSAPPHSSAGPTRSRRTLLVTVAAVVALLLAVAAVWFFVLRDGTPAASASGDPPADAEDIARFGVPTVTDGCPAADVPDAGARCTRRAQCWSEIVIIQGELGGIRELPCDRQHVFETFAIAEVPAAVTDPYQDALVRNATVRKVCSTRTLLASRQPDVRRFGADDWSIEVLPPTPEDQESGREIYRCVARLTGAAGGDGPVFRPR
jgi:serine/threonine protein kinase